MRILVLMPLDEQHVYAASKIYENLSDEIKMKTFAMPMFMEYMINTKQAKNWLYAFFDSLISAKSIYNASVAAQDDLLVIGNTKQEFKFDAVFNFQEIDEALPYQDNLLNRLLKDPEFTNDPILFQTIAALHGADESQLSLMDCKATANFLDAYMKTDPHLEELEAHYDDMFKKFNDEGGLLLIDGKEITNKSAHRKNGTK